MTYKQMLDAIDLLNRQVKVLEDRIALLERQNTFYQHRHDPLQPPWTVTFNQKETQ